MRVEPAMALLLVAVRVEQRVVVLVVADLDGERRDGHLQRAEVALVLLDLQG